MQNGKVFLGKHQLGKEWAENYYIFFLHFQGISALCSIEFFLVMGGKGGGEWEEEADIVKRTNLHWVHASGRLVEPIQEWSLGLKRKDSTGVKKKM